MKIAYT